MYAGDFLPQWCLKQCESLCKLYFALRGMENFWQWKIVVFIHIIIKKKNFRYKHKNLSTTNMFCCLSENLDGTEMSFPYCIFNWFWKISNLATKLRLLFLCNLVSQSAYCFKYLTISFPNDWLKSGNTKISEICLCVLFAFQKYLAQGYLLQVH